MNYLYSLILLYGCLCLFNEWPDGLILDVKNTLIGYSMITHKTFKLYYIIMFVYLVNGFYFYVKNTLIGYSRVEYELFQLFDITLCLFIE